MTKAKTKPEQTNAKEAELAKKEEELAKREAEMKEREAKLEGAEKELELEEEEKNKSYLQKRAERGVPQGKPEGPPVDLPPAGSNEVRFNRQGYPISNKSDNANESNESALDRLIPR